MPIGEGLLGEQQRLEANVARIRWACVALIAALGPLFPNLSGPAVLALGVLVALYNVVASRASARSRSLEQHVRIAEATFGADLVAVSAAMLLFSADPYWTTFFVGTLAIIGGAFRFGGSGGYVAAAVLSLSYIGITVFRARAFAMPVEPQRAAFHLSVFGLTALLIDRVLHDYAQVRTERERLITELERQLEENQRLFAQASEAQALRELDRLKDEFLATVSHELRTPLTVISGSLELLGRRAGELSDDARHLLRQAERHAGRLQQSVEELLDIAQLQEARIELARELVGARSLLAEIAANAEAILEPKRQVLRLECGDDVPPVLADKRRMHQILGNLVQNASRYAPEGSGIELRAERAGDAVRFAVMDEGPGIPPDERERVFEKFYRGERIKGTTTGTGLGLAIARTLVELHGGRIWVEDGPSGGARFVVEVPCDPVPATSGV